MLVPGAVLDSEGRLTATVGAGTVPDSFNSGFGLMEDGSVAIDTDTPDPEVSEIYNAGLQVSLAGAIYGTTTDDPGDSFLSGCRVSAIGQLVYNHGVGVPEFYTSGNPVDADGIVQTGDPVPLPPPVVTDTFVVTAGLVEFDETTTYVGADPTGFVVSEPFGSIDPNPLTTSDLTIIEFEANAPIETPVPQVVFGLSLQAPGELPADTDAFTSITYYGPTGTVTLLRSEADGVGGPDGQDGGIVRTWTWSTAAWYFENHGVYTVTITY